ncbi:MGMT family protein [candidate division WWE3 bacterium]|nr:MGMT family protein [candidate division WWE3 bacterium]
MTKFKENVIKIVSKIPYGKVMSYGQVALCASFPRGARQVGWILNKLNYEETKNLPWWRVVNNEGRISIKNSEYLPPEQKQKLEAEGLKIKKDLTFDINNYRYIPTPEEYLELTDDFLDEKF